MRTGKAGVREARARLSRLIRDVQRGGQWVITQRGKPIARLVPVAEESLPLEERIRRLEEAGVLEPLRQAPHPLPPPLPLEKNLAQRWLQEDRGR
jgi:prevent-host-death family protein